MIKEGFNSAKVDVIYNSIELLKSSLLNEFIFEKDKYFSNISLPILIFIGRLTKTKNWVY